VLLLQPEILNCTQYRDNNNTKGNDGEINELRTKIDNIKEETTQDMENHRKKNETELQNKQKPIQETRTNRRQNLRPSRSNGN
jgi:hypothetical protein